MGGVGGIVITTRKWRAFAHLAADRRFRHPRERKGPLDYLFMK